MQLLSEYRVRVRVRVRARVRASVRVKPVGHSRHSDLAVPMDQSLACRLSSVGV